MDPKTIVALLTNDDVQSSLHQIFDRSSLEKFSFIAIIVSTIISFVALSIVYIQLRKQIKDSAASTNNIQEQLGLLRTQIADDHARSRREIALDMLRLWVTTLRHESQSTRRFVERLDIRQCQALNKYEPISVKNDDKELLLSCLQHSYQSQSIEEYLTDQGYIRPRYATHIRFVAVSYLNHLETILTAWYHSIGDQEIIKDQFSYLFNPQLDEFALERFRTAIGMESFPSINAFIAALREEHRKQGTPERPTGNVMQPRSRRTS